MILNVYKPKGITSFKVVSLAKQAIHAKYPKLKVKVGHAGTLDPLAEGVLIVLTGADTKKQDSFMAYDKEYSFNFLLGATSLSYDMEQPLIYSEKYSELMEMDIQEVEQILLQLVSKYTGVIQQAVPLYSAVKVEGKKLYKVARKQEATKDKAPSPILLQVSEHLVELPVKEVRINSFDILNVDKKKIHDAEPPSGTTGTTAYEHFVVSAKISCSKGTYVRSLVHDIGQDLGYGAVLYSLVRTKIGEFSANDSIKLDELADKVLP